MRARGNKGKNKNSHPSKLKKAFLLALGAGTAGGAAFLTWDYFRKKKSGDQSPETTSDWQGTNMPLPAKVTVKTGVRTNQGANDKFPLKKGSSGPRVMQLQQALKANLVIDGKLGTATINALKKAGYGTTIDEAAYNKITGKTATPAIVFDPQEIARTLYNYAQGKDKKGVLLTLQRIRSVDEYAKVNAYYKRIPFISKTIVTDLLDFSFKDDEATKQQIRNDFFRIGLTQDETGKWKLAGLQGLYKDVITIRDTIITDRYYNKIPVKKNTILGEEVTNANGVTWFKSLDNTLNQVPSQDIKYV